MHQLLDSDVEAFVAITVDMVPPTVNHYKEPTTVYTKNGAKRGWRLTDEARTFRELTCVVARGKTVIPADEGEHATVRYGLYAYVFRGPARPQNLADGDNYWKCIADSLQHAGVIHNDSRVRVWHLEPEDDDPNPRVEICAIRFTRRDPCKMIQRASSPVARRRL